MSVDNIRLNPYSVSNNKLRDELSFKGNDSKEVTLSHSIPIEELPKVPNDLLIQSKNLNYRRRDIQKENPKYELGQIIDGVRTVNVSNVTRPSKFDSSGFDKCSASQRESYVENIKTINQEIDSFRQGRRGDCYLLASLYSISQTQNGDKILAKNFTYNDDGSVIVTFPGALKAKKGYEDEGNGDKCAITGKYKITKEAIEKAKKLSGFSYAYGDIDVILTELAMEAYRAEVVDTNKALNQRPEAYIPGQCGTKNEIDTLSGGQLYDANYILTGKKSEFYISANKLTKPVKLYYQGEFGYVGVKSKMIGSKYSKSRKDEKEVLNVYNKDSDLQKLLDTYKGNENKYAITVGVICGRKGVDGVTKKGGGHALSVTKITDEYVELVNPWDTTKKERIPRAIFEDMACALNITEI